MRIFKPTKLLKDEHGQQVFDANGDPVYVETSQYFHCEWYDVNGLQKQRSLKTSKITEARVEAAKINGAKANKEPTTPGTKLTFEDGLRMVTEDYEAKHQDIKSFPGRCKHLRPVFGDRYLAAISAADITGYRAHRTKEKAPDATINAELALLRRMYGVAKEHGIKIVQPYFLMPVPANARQGFFEPEEDDAVVELLPRHQRGALTIARRAGWRMRSEVFNLTWAMVSRSQKTITLPPGLTKNKKQRTLHYATFVDIDDMIEAQWASAQAVQRRENRLVSHVFHLTTTIPKGTATGRGTKRPGTTRLDRLAGDPINIWDFYRDWRIAVTAAGYSHRIPHDFRRTATRNLLRGGNHEKVCMAITGHLTPHIFKRYDITTAEDQHEAGRKLQAYLKTQAAAASGKRGKVLQHRDGAATMMNHWLTRWLLLCAFLSATLWVYFHSYAAQWIGR